MQHESGTPQPFHSPKAPKPESSPKNPIPRILKKWEPGLPAFKHSKPDRLLGVTWFLAVEEQFYLFVPLLIYFLPRRVLICVLVAAIVAAPILRWASPGFHAFVNTPWRSDSLLSGALLAVLVRWHPFVSAVRQHRGLVMGLFIVLLAGFAVMTLLVGFAVVTLGSASFSIFTHLWLAALYSTFVLIAFVGSAPSLGRMLGFRLLVWFGQLSYGIYMFHQAVSGLLHGYLEPVRKVLDLAGGDFSHPTIFSHQHGKTHSFLIWAFFGSQNPIFGRGLS